MSQKKLILLVEDDPDISALMEKKLSIEGFDVKKIMDGEEAINYLETNIPDFVILDILMPKIEGISVLQMIHDGEKTNKIPVIVLSNLDSQDSRDQVNAVGDYEYFVKAKTDLDDLVKRIKEKLGI
ncbi:response regulator [Patescibacteria group bacterium]|nr:response regulator [Patescibacteria group bacterium]